MERALTPLMARWAEEALGAAPPEEPEATCHNCVMCTPEPGPRFLPDVKCCMYLPALKNFQVGLALRTEEGRRTTLPRLATASVISFAIATSSRLSALSRSRKLGTEL